MRKVYSNFGDEEHFTRCSQDFTRCSPSPGTPIRFPYKYILKDANICNFTFYVLKNEMEKLEDHSEIAITWFECNNMKLNTDKCHLLVPGHRYEEMWIKVRPPTSKSE